MAAFYDANGALQQLSLSVEMYRAAAEQGKSLPQYLNAEFPTDNAELRGNTWEQVLASEGIFVKGDKEFGFKGSTIAEVIDGRTAASGVVKEASPASRILFPAVVLSAVENKLVGDLSMTANAFDQMVAVDDTITGDRYERPVLDFAAPEAGRAKTISQLAEPNVMMSITASDISRKIPTYSLGMVISDQAKQASSLDLVSLAIARQVAVQRNEMVNDQILTLINGDVDMGYGSLSSAGKVTTAVSLDAAAASGLTQKAWMKWLFQRSTKRRITHVICDIDSALAIEGRTGKPTVQSDDPQSPRMDTLFSVMNPTWPNSVQLFLIDPASNPSFPAKTILGIDASQAIHRVTSATAGYQAVEQWVLKRAEAMRFDFGYVVDRLFDDAFEVLTYA